MIKIFPTFSILLAAVGVIAPVTIAALSAAAAPSKIAVLGATGNLGQQTLRECLERSIPVKCLVRNPSKLPEEFQKSPLVEVVTGDLLSEASQNGVVFGDALIGPSEALLECLEGCGSVVACYGATRRTKLGDLFRNPEDTDPTHAKQINYRSMIALAAACQQVNAKGNNNNNQNKIRHIVRITGKGEDPTGFFSVILNGLGAFCKAWNYQGENVIREMLGSDKINEDSIGYTIVRPGIMQASEKFNDDNGASSVTNDDLLLVDQGGNDLKVTPVAYSQIANLLVELVLSAGDGRIGAQNKRVTLAAMNPPKDDDGQQAPSVKSLADKIAALQNDSREYPASLVAEHKAAVKAFFTKVAVVLSACGIALATLVAKIFF